MQFSPLLVVLSTFSLATALLEGSCIAGDPALKWLSTLLSSRASISCKGYPLANYNAGRYWGKQFGKNASVVIFPFTTQDVSYAVQAANLSPLGRDFAFVSGAHSMTNASSSYGMVIDLLFMNGTEILANTAFGGVKDTVVAYQGGANWLQVAQATKGSGYTAVGARVGNVGVGGFSTGGGIGFLAGAYGYAIDRLVAMEVVLITGQVVMATKDNLYCDLFWALQGGGGQFGIVTKFYQRAAVEPLSARFGINFITDASQAQARANTAKFFATNQDPFSLMYYVLGVFPSNPLDPTNRDFGLRTVIVTAYFDDPTNPKQLSADNTFAPLLAGLDTTYNVTVTVPYSDATEVIDTFFPYGFRRGFYGPQITNVTTAYLEAITQSFDAYIGNIATTGDAPITALWALQYMHPGLNGNLPTSDQATAWPHTTAGHQTLFSPAYTSALNDLLTLKENTDLNTITYKFQAQTGKFIADYPNYISPDAGGKRVWGDNVQRLINIKSKYDPLCRIHNGRVFASPACVVGGWANIFAK